MTSSETTATPAATREEAIKRNDEAQKNSAKLRADANEKRVAAEEARKKADLEKLGKDNPSEKAAREAYQEADDAAAAAAQGERDAQGRGIEATISDAKVLGYGKHEELHAGHHLAQKFGNDPANPRASTGLPEVTEDGMVKLQRTTPDSSTPIYTSCHPDLVGDYMRAGWNRADTQPQAPARIAAARETAADGTSLVDDKTNETLGDDDEEEYEDAQGRKARRTKAKTAASKK